MQYNISINQKAAIDNECFKDLDLIDLALFDFIYHFFNCDIADKITFRYNDKEYVEIRHQLIEKEMPLLKFGCRKTFIGRMSKLVSAGLISRYENNSKENRSGYCRGENFSKMIFSSSDTKEQPVTKKLQGCESEVTGGVTDELHNHIQLSSIENKEHIKEDTKVSKKDRDLLFEECWALYGRRGSKGKSKEIWYKLNDDELKLIKPHIQAYVQSVSDKKYQKWFERYLRDKTFKDVVYKGNMIIFDPERENNTDNEYRPQLDGFNLHWNEQVKCYISMYDIDMLFDGYTAENRPSSAMVMKGGIRYKWNTQTKKWEVQ